MSVYPERSKCGHEKYWAGNCGTCMACLAEKAEQGLSAALVKLAEAEKTVKSFRELPKTVETEIAKCGHNRYWTTHFGACMCCQLEAAESRLKLCDDGTPDARGKFRVIEAEARAKNAEAKLAAMTRERNELIAAQDAFNKSDRMFREQVANLQSKLAALTAPVPVDELGRALIRLESQGYGVERELIERALRAKTAELEYEKSVVQSRQAELKEAEERLKVRTEERDSYLEAVTMAEAKLAALEKVAAMARIVCAELENPNPDQHYEDEAKLTHALDELDAAQEKKS